MHFIMSAAGINRGTMRSIYNKEGEGVVGRITLRHVYEIAKVKAADPTLKNVEMREICMKVIGCARTIGVEVVDEIDPVEYAQFLELKRAQVAKQLKELEERRQAKVLRTTTTV